MNAWTRHLARSLFGLGPAAATAPAGMTKLALQPPPRQSDPDETLLCDCAAVLARREQELERLGAIPTNDWERFAEEIGAADDRSRDLVRQICLTPARTPNGLRVKAETLSLLLEDPEPDEVEDQVEAAQLRQIARALVTDILAMLAAAPNRFGT